MNQDGEARVPRRRRSTAAVVVAGLALVGCGGDDDETTAPANGGLSKEEYVAEVREAVGPIATESQELIDRATDAKRVEDLAEPLADAEQVYRNTAEQLESLKPPTEVDELHDELVQAQEDVAEAAQAAERSARQGDREGLEEFRRAGERYRERAERLSDEFAERGFEF